MPNPLKEAIDWVELHKPTGSTVGAKFPIGPLSTAYVQVGWDGSPTDADNREDAAIRVTVWAPKSHPGDAADAAEHLRAGLLADQGTGRPNLFRVDRGSGRLPGVDADTELPFCTFSLNVVLHALTP